MKSLDVNLILVLTFNDVTSIKKVFIRTLTGMYHSRIQYPDIEEDKNEIQPHSIEYEK